MLTLLNTRPIEQAKELNNLLQKAGFDSINCPALKIETLQISEQKSPRGYVFFISANAVIQFMAQLSSAKDFFKNSRVYAIGRATQKHLAKYDIQAINPLPPFNSQSVLKLLPDNLQNKPCVIIKGQGGLTDLATGLKNKQGQVTEIDCYKRVASPFCINAWRDFKQRKQTAVLITSLASIQSLINTMPETEVQILLQQTAIVFSQRIQQQIQTIGWTGNTYITDEQNNLAIIRSLKELAS